MNMKTVLGIISVSLVSGGVICLVKRYVIDNKTDAESSDKEPAGGKDHEIVRSQEASEAESGLDEDKSDAAEKIFVRHEEAGKVMREAVNTVFDDSQPESTKNDEAFEKMSEDLDNI